MTNDIKHLKKGLCWLLFLFFAASCNKEGNTVEYIAHKVSLQGEPGEREYYRVISCYPSKYDCNKKMYASSFLCSGEKYNDTVIVIVKCESYKIKPGNFAGIYKNDTKDGELLNVAFKKNGKEEFNRYKKIYGSLKMPID